VKIVVIGGGAIGTLFAARLSGLDPLPSTSVVVLSHWTEQAKALRHGLRLIELDGSETRFSLNAITDPTAIGPTADLALICVKSPQTDEAAHRAKAVLQPDGLAMSLQNGLGNRAVIAAVLGEERTLQGVTNQGATLIEPGVLRHAGNGHTYLAGPPARRPELQAVQSLFTAAGLETELTADLDGLVWGKLIVNVGINALSAILRVSNGHVAEIAPAADLMTQAVIEAAAVAEAAAIRLPYPDPVAHVRLVAAATFPNRSSMLVDVLRGVPTEIRAINSAVVNEGRRLGVDTPVNALLTQLIEAIEAGYLVRL
jgi:2-dehydropantoate 2-reductase